MKTTALRVVTNSRPMHHTHGTIYPLGTYHTRAEKKPSWFKRIMRSEGRR